jgi:O-antigen ligase
MWHSLYTDNFLKSTAFVFLLSVVAAIGFEAPLLLTVPFILLAAPYVFKQVVYKTENLFWLLMITLPLSTEINFTASLGIDFPDELLMMLLTGMFLVKLIVNKRIFSKNVLLHPIFFLLVLHLTWILISVMFSVDPPLSFKYFIAKSWFIIPFVLLPQLLLNNKRGIQKLLICILLPMMLIVMQSLIRHAQLNFSFEGVKEIYSPFFRNHVNFSAFLACCIPMLWYGNKLTPATSRWKKYIQLSLCFSVAGLVFAYSRGAWLALIICAIIVFIIKRKLMLQTILAAIVFVIASVWWLATDNNYLRFKPDYNQTIFHPDIKEHLNATVQMKDLSNAERFYRWVAGARMVAEEPIIGFGPNNFYNNYRPYAVDIFKTYVSDNAEHSSVHNYFLLLALEQGFPGLLLFCVLIFAMLLAVQRLYHQIQDVFYKTTALVIGSVLAIIITVNTLSDLIETDKIGSLFWLCLGFLFILERKAKAEKKFI